MFHTENSSMLEKPLNFIEHYDLLIFSLYFLASIIVALLTIIYIRHIKSKMRTREYKLLLKYRDLFDNMPIPYLRCKIRSDREAPDLLVLDVNKAFNEKVLPKIDILHKNREQLEQTSLGSMERFLDISQEILITKETHRGEYLINGSYYTVIIRLSEEEDVVDVFFVDVTKLKNYRENLELVNYKLSIAIEAANMVCWYYDIKNDIFSVKKMVAEYDSLTGKTHRRLVEDKKVPLETALMLVHTDFREQARELFRQLISGEICRGHLEYQLSDLNIYNDKEVSWEEMLVEVEYDSKGNVIALDGIFMPITEQKLLEQSLRDALSAAEEANRLKSAFLANMSHEIRTPLNAIIGFSNLLINVETEEEKQEYIGIIESNNALLLKLINDIFDLAMIDAETLDFNESRTCINHIIDEIATSARMTNRNKDVQIISSKGLMECYAVIAKHRLMQVLTNLMNNSMKFTEKGTITVGYEYDQRESLLKFFVRDTGIGIPKNKVKEIFHRFTKLNTFIQGSGLGLSICEMIIHKLGGRIWVDSEIDRGTCFWFTVPYQFTE
ncbi:sensor histidine kinase [Parabacteroides goldsteinii]|uniref:sensor histidine kinase n=1 Tax=Parabacteroides goldsteinii TaxID=328812 RepID=UPI002593AF49|nr:ATP-binding protein [Parabacteroides goldsteinii]